MSETTTNGGVGRVAGAGASPSPAPAAAPAATNAPPPKEGKALRDKTAYRVLDVRSSILYFADDAQLAAWLKGDRIPYAERKMKEAPSGSVVTDLPATSVPGLLKSGWICKADGPDDPYRKGAKDNEGGEA